MIVAIYARVSTTDQDCEMQLAELRGLAARSGWVVSGEYVDTISGAKASRPNLDRLMADARLHRFDAIICWKLDRWGRSLSNCLNSIEELDRLGIRFIVPGQNIDTDINSPVGRLLMHILGAVGQFERELTRERAPVSALPRKRESTVEGLRECSAVTWSSRCGNRRKAGGRSVASWGSRSRRFGWRMQTRVSRWPTSKLPQSSGSG